MIFQERKKDNGFIYTVEDIFGTITIDSETKLEPGILDDLVMVLLRQNITAGEINGEVKTKSGVVNYSFVKRPMWENDEEDETQCTDIPTSTNEPASLFIQIRQLMIRTLAWCRQFVVAFQEAYRKTKNNK